MKMVQDNIKKKILTKHIEDIVSTYDSEFKELEFPNMTDEEIIAKKVDYYQSRSEVLENGTVWVRQSRGYIVIDKDGNTVDGVYADAF